LRLPLLPAIPRRPAGPAPSTARLSRGRDENLVRQCRSHAGRRRAPGPARC